MHFYLSYIKFAIVPYPIRYSTTAHKQGKKLGGGEVQQLLQCTDPASTQACPEGEPILASGKVGSAKGEVTQFPVQVE